MYLLDTILERFESSSPRSNAYTSRDSASDKFYKPCFKLDLKDLFASMNVTFPLQYFKYKTILNQITVHRMW